MPDFEEKKSNFLEAVKGTAKKASEKAITAAGNLKDAAGNLKDAAIREKDKLVQMNAEKKQLMEEKRMEDDRERLCPIFEEDLNAELLRCERIIRIVNYDERLEKDVCKGSIGYFEKTKNRRIPTFYMKYASLLNVNFYPILSESVYIADPCIAGKYIEIDEYYAYMKQVRVNELTVIAQSLGAKHIVISMNATSEEESADSRSVGSDSNVAGLGLNVDAKKKENESRKAKVAVWADTVFETSYFIGGPSVPPVLYFRQESDISTLIEMVLSGQSRLVSRTYKLSASASSGLALSEALSIDGAMKAISCKAGASLAKTAEKESRSVLEYTIEF